MYIITKFYFKNEQFVFWLIGDTEWSIRKSVWIVGSSIIKRDFVYARGTFEGFNLDLRRRDCSLWWQGKGGMYWGGLIPRVKYLLRFNQPPDFLVIHCGGNSFGAVKLRELRCQIKDSLDQLMALLPSTKLIWSQILPRISWRYSQNSRALNRAAARINNYAAWICIQAGGGYIRDPELAWNETMVFCEDGVHLSDIGNELFLFRIQAYLFDFI